MFAPEKEFLLHLLQISLKGQLEQQHLIGTVVWAHQACVFKCAATHDTILAPEYFLALRFESHELLDTRGGG